MAFVTAALTEEYFALVESNLLLDLHANSIVWGDKNSLNLPPSCSIYWPYSMCHNVIAVYASINLLGASCTSMWSE